MAQQETAPHRPLVDGMTRIFNRSEDFIHSWLEVMRPFHRLTPREIDFAAAMLEKRYEIAAKIADPKKNQATIDKLLFDEETKEAIRQKVGITKSHMQVILHKMREVKMIDNKSFSPEYIPDWTPGKRFRMVFIFENKLDDA